MIEVVIYCLSEETKYNIVQVMTGSEQPSVYDKEREQGARRSGAFVKRRKPRSMCCIADAPDIALHSTNALEGCRCRGWYHVAAMRMANLARVVYAIYNGGQLASSAILDGHQHQQQLECELAGDARPDGGRGRWG